MADIRSTLISKSDQLDNIDLMGGPQIFTVTSATVNEGAEQPLSIKLREFGRAWKPGLTMRRILNEIWGYETDDWTGRRVRLYRDDQVSFNKTKTGGTRISHASHMDKAITLTLPTSKGKFGEFRIEPLVEAAPAAPTPEPIAVTAAKAADYFATRNVPQSSLEAHVGKPIAEWDAADLAELKASTEQIAGGRA
jgi:hypothetical protein